MWTTACTKVLSTSFAAVLSFGSCGDAEEFPAVVPKVEPGDAPSGGNPAFPSQIELELCDRRFPLPRC